MKDSCCSGTGLFYCDTSVTLQAQDSAYKSTWRSVPSVHHSGSGMASKAASLFESQHVNKNPLDQRLLQEDAIRRSGVSGPLGMGVVLQSELFTADMQGYQKPTHASCNSFLHWTCLPSLLSVNQSLQYQLPHQSVSQALISKTEHA